MKKSSELPTNKKICLALILALILGLLPAYQSPLAGETTATGADGKPGTPVTAIRLFSKYISPIDGDRCSMWPTCSHYASDSIKKHGLLKGWIMASDRLLRCGGDETNSPQYMRINGRRYSADPVENNDFWWYNRKVPDK